jgi:hypothetical protein
MEHEPQVVLVGNSGVDVEGTPVNTATPLDVRRRPRYGEGDVGGRRRDAPAARGGGIVIKGIVLGLVFVTLLALGIAQATADDSEPARVCVSAVGPVGPDGRGGATPVQSGDCP